MTNFDYPWIPPLYSVWFARPALIVQRRFYSAAPFIATNVHDSPQLCWRFGYVSITVKPLAARFDNSRNIYNAKTEPARNKATFSTAREIATTIPRKNNRSDILYFDCSSRNFPASFKKLTAIIMITIPIGNAAIMLTDCRLLMEFSENTRPIGKRINKTHHINSTSL